MLVDFDFETELVEQDAAAASSFLPLDILRVEVRGLFEGGHDADGGGWESRTTSESESSQHRRESALPLSTPLILESLNYDDYQIDSASIARISSANCYQDAIMSS